MKTRTQNLSDMNAQPRLNMNLCGGFKYCKNPCGSHDGGLVLSFFEHDGVRTADCIF